MANIIVIDALWGDCGAKNICFQMSHNYDWQVRYNCQNKTTIINNKFKYKYLPCVDYKNSKTKSFLSENMKINLQELFLEILQFEKYFPGMGKNIYIDPNLFIIDKQFIGKLSILIEQNSQEILKLKQIGVNFTPLSLLIDDFKKSNILFENDVEVLKDIDINNIIFSEDFKNSIKLSGFNFITIDKIYGVIAPYLTKKNDKFLHTKIITNSTNIQDNASKQIGWLDFVLLKFIINKVGISHLILNKLNNIIHLKEIGVAVFYANPEIKMEILTDIDPLKNFNKLKNFVVIYEIVSMWKNLDDENIKKFIYLCEDITKIKIEHIFWN